MRRTQLYLDDHLWNALHARARSQKTTVSELVREAARERYLGGRDELRKAMQEFVGSQKRRSDPVDIDRLRSVPLSIPRFKSHFRAVRRRQFPAGPGHDDPGSRPDGEARSL